MRNMHASHEERTAAAACPAGPIVGDAREDDDDDDVPPTADASCKRAVAEDADSDAAEAAGTRIYSAHARAKGCQRREESI